MKRKENQDYGVDPCNVFVKYLPAQVTDADFFQLFSSFGDIVSSRVMVDHAGNSLGYGFVRFQTPAESQAAIQAMNGQAVANKRLLCKLSNVTNSSGSGVAQHKSNNLYIKSLLPSTTVEDLNALFSPYGNIVESKVMVDKTTGISRQIGFVRFETPAEADAALKALSGQPLEPNHSGLTIKFADNENQKEARKARLLGVKGGGLVLGGVPSYAPMYSFDPNYGAYVGMPYPSYTYRHVSSPPPGSSVPFDPARGVWLPGSPVPQQQNPFSSLAGVPSTVSPLILDPGNPAQRFGFP